MKLLARCRAAAAVNLVSLVALAGVVGLSGCGSTESSFEQAQKHSQEAARKLHQAEAKMQASSAAYNRELNRQFRQNGGQEVCEHLRAHQLHSNSPILAKEAAEYLAEEC